MGKRNLAIVGTHEDYFAEVFDERTGTDPSVVAHCASPEDAANSYFQSMFENSNALIRAATIAVWPVAAGRDDQVVFDVDAVLTPCEEPGEFEVSVDVRKRT